MTDYIRDQIKTRRAEGHYPKVLKKQKVFCPKANGKIYKKSCLSPHNKCKYKQMSTCIIRRSIKCKLTKSYDKINKEYDFEYVKIAHCIHRCDKFNIKLIICTLNFRYEKLNWEFSIQNDCRYRSIDVCNWNPQKSRLCVFKSCRRLSDVQKKHEAKMKQRESST